MKSFPRLSLAVLLAALLFACSGPTKPDEAPFQFPFAVGNQWTYEYTLVTDFDEPKTDDTIQFTVVVSIAKADTILPGICAYEFHERNSEMSDDDPPGVEAYLDLPSGMYSYYTCNPGVGVNLPKVTSAAYTVVFGGLRFNSLLELAGTMMQDEFLAAGVMGNTCYGKTLRNPPRLVLPYPQHVGDEWLVSDTVGDISIRAEKKIARMDIRTTPAGSFECYAVETAYTPGLGQIGRTWTVTDYYSEQGMIERKSIARDVPYQTVDFPYAPPDTVDLIFSNRLTSFSIVSQ